MGLGNLDDELALAMAEHAPDATMVVGADGLVVWLNQAAEDLFGYQAEELIGQTMERLVPEQARAMHQSLRRKFGETPWTRRMGAQNRPITGRRKDGTTVDLEIMLAPVGRGNVLAVVRDVSARVKTDAGRRLVQRELTMANEKLTRTNEELSRANAELAALNDQKSRLLAMVSHDLRGPLAEVSGTAALLESDETLVHSSLARDGLEQIAKASQHMLALVDDLFDISTMRAGTLKLQLAPTDLGAIIERVVGVYQRIATRKNINVHLENRVSCPIVMADASRIEQVASNLVSNAVKFSPVDSKVEVVLHEAGNEVRLCVADQGPGIPPEDRPKLFQAFERTGARPTGGEPSVGLGLAIVQCIVLGHHGRVWVEDRPEGGAAFHVALAKVD